MPKYYCDYCDRFLTHDSFQGRKQHNRGKKHQDNIRMYFNTFLATHGPGGVELTPMQMMQMQGPPMMPFMPGFPPQPAQGFGPPPPFRFGMPPPGPYLPQGPARFGAPPGPPPPIPAGFRADQPRQ